MQTTTPSAKWYRHITELPLNKFIDCKVDDNLYALVITGQPAIEDLKAAWASILQEEADQSGDHEHQMYVSLYRDVKILETTLFQIHWLVGQLKEVYYVELAKRLNKLLLTNFKFDYTNPEQYFKELSRCMNRSKGIKIDLDLKLQQFEAIHKSRQEQGEGKKPTREYYQAILITLSDHVKYPVSDLITVYEFCDRMRRCSASLSASEISARMRGSCTSCLSSAVKNGLGEPFTVTVVMSNCVIVSRMNARSSEMANAAR